MVVAENIEEHKGKLKFFMQKFCGIIRNMDSTHKELSIAIRGYGFFATVRSTPCLLPMQLLEAKTYFTRNERSLYVCCYVYIRY